MGSIVAKFRGPNDPSMPAFVGLADSWNADIWGAGHMGSRFEPVKGAELAGRFAMPPGATVDRLRDRNQLRQEFDRLRRDLDNRSTLAKLDDYNQQPFDMVLSGKVQRASQTDEEPDSLRDTYGRGSLGERHCSLDDWSRLA